MYEDKLIITDTGVYPLEFFEPRETTLKKNVAYSLVKEYGDTDIFLFYKGHLKETSEDPGIYKDENEIPLLIKPTTEEEPEYLISTHIANTDPGDMLVVLKDKSNIQHVYNESSKLYIPDIEESDNILKRALKQAFKCKDVSIEACKEGFTDKNAFFNFSSVMRSVDGNVTFLLFDRGCSALNLDYTIILHEKDPDNTIGKSLNDPEVVGTLRTETEKLDNKLVEDNSISLDGTITVSSTDTFSL